VDTSDGHWFKNHLTSGIRIVNEWFLKWKLIFYIKMGNQEKHACMAVFFVPFFVSVDG
jgi:hypothetical protein